MSGKQADDKSPRFVICTERYADVILREGSEVAGSMPVWWMLRLARSMTSGGACSMTSGWGVQHDNERDCLTCTAVEQYCRESICPSYSASIDE